MIHSSRFTAFLDTNVIYPIIIRDILFWFAHYDLFTPKWSEDIFREWKSVMVRKGVGLKEIKKRINTVKEAFPDAMVENYEQLSIGLELPDKNDRHVLAAAIKAQADIIVTNNIKDFPPDYLSEFGLSVKNADGFLVDIIDLNSQIALEAFREMVLYKANPLLDEYDILTSLRRVDLRKTADFIERLL